MIMQYKNDENLAFFFCKFHFPSYCRELWWETFESIMKVEYKVILQIYLDIFLFFIIMNSKLFRVGANRERIIK